MFLRLRKENSSWGLDSVCMGRFVLTMADGPRGAAAAATGQALGKAGRLDLGISVAVLVVPTHLNTPQLPRVLKIMPPNP